jgi:hypothetical protein
MGISEHNIKLLTLSHGKKRKLDNRAASGLKKNQETVGGKEAHAGGKEEQAPQIAI